MTDSRYVTPEASEPSPERFKLYRLCGDRELNIVATATDPESLGVAIVTLAREGEFIDCPAIGILDSMGDKGQKWLVKPWGPYPAEASAAGRTLRAAQTKG